MANISWLAVRITWMQQAGLKQLGVCGRYNWECGGRGRCAANTIGSDAVRRREGNDGVIDFGHGMSVGRVDGFVLGIERSYEML
jgi:hypothetical protein